MIYLPVTLHAKLKLEAIKRAVSMSEVALSAISLFLLGEQAPKTEAAPVELGPFVGRFGEVPERPIKAGAGAEKTGRPQAQAAQEPAAVPPQQDTYEVE